MEGDNMNFVDDATATLKTKEAGNEAPNVRYMYLDDSTQITLTRKDPYGFIWVTNWRGTTNVPTPLSGAYSDWDGARAAVRAHIARNVFAQETEEPVPKVEPLKYKKRYRDAETGENIPQSN